ncbi:RNA-directed DNA polymerase, eukaryota [Tanacetum coccineum]
MAARNRSNSDHTRLISKSIFVTNFPDNTSAKDLWEVCKGYGTVVDVFIPNRKSRSGKRFAFVRFIKVGNVDRLVENLCTLWIGRMHLHANVVRYDRPPISSSRPNVAPRPTVKSVSRPSANGASSFVSVLKGNPNTINHISTSPAMVLDDECLVERDLDNFVLGEVKDFSSINNLLILLSNEGFQHVRLVYLGGLWVMIELPSIETKTRFMKHVGVASWFSQLRTAQSDFVSRERIVWIDIEGVPLHAWSRPTFSKIGSRWGEVLELEDNKDDCFARKRICIKTKQEDNILEKFKIIVRGKIFVVRAKELFVWSPSFKGVNDAEFVSDDDSVNGEEEKNDDMSKKVNLEDESDIEGVSETVFGDQDDPLVQELNQNSLPNEKEISSDPFNLYNLINKRDKGEENTGLDSSLPFPPGFTPADQVKSDRKNSPLHSHSGGLNSRVLEESQPTKDQGSPKDNLNQRVGGSILEVIDDMIKVGQAMGLRSGGAIEGDENSKFFHGIINRKRANLAIKGVMVDGDWVDDPCRMPHLESPVSRDEVRNAVWGCVEWFFEHSSFSRGCNSLFIALIPKNQDPKFVNDYRPISLIGSLYKDLLEDVLIAFGFGPKWCSWIRGCLHSGMASVLLNGSPSSEFQFYCGLKQGDPLAPYLFLLVMESLHLSVSRAIEAGIFKGIKIDSTLNLSHLFYADDVVFIGEWSPSNLSGITNILHCFSLLSGLSINLKKSNLLGVGVRSEYVKDAAVNLGCLTMKTPFKYLGVMVGGICATSQAWEDTIGKLKARLSNWKLKTLSVGGRLTLLKSVLGSTPIYNLSIYKAPKSVLHSMESLRRNFFNGSQCNERKIAWIKWTTTLASKKNGGLGISSLYALNRALLFKWVWRFISRDNSLWCRLILSMHGSKLPSSSPFRYSTWLFIIREIHSLKDRGVDLVSHCRIHVGNGLRINFWKEVWIGDNPLCVLFSCIFALETNKDSSVAVKLSSVTSSLRRPVRGGSESSQLSLLQEYIEGTILSSLEDRWVWDLNGEGVFCVKDVRNLLDDVFLPKAPIATRWIKYVPIKLNVFAWKVHLNRLPTRVNLQHRGVLVSDPSCPICHSEDEDLAHLFFRCSLVTDIVRLVCRWWNIAWASIDSYSNWLHWFNAIRLSPKVKDLLEGVFYITWWSIWRFRNQVLFSSLVPRKDVLFDDIVSRSFTWCRSRCKSNFSWVSWLQHPYLISL